jgi:hypothetical protein
MLDELRNHDATPTQQERWWLEVSPLHLAVRIAALAAVSVMIGVGASFLLDAEPYPATTAAAASR